MTAAVSHIRQGVLGTLPNPHQLQDYLVQHDSSITAAGRVLKICIRMVPDKDIAQNTSLNDYLKTFAHSDVPLETLASHILEDLLNTLIPRFLHIELIHEQDGQLHRIVMEEKQPKWSNTALLARLSPL